MNVQEFYNAFTRVRQEISRVLLGQDEIIDHVLYSVFSRGHVLIEGVPGVGKTLLVRTLSHVMGCDFKRIQFTPDLMPSDVTGGNMYNQKANEFQFLPGPIFTQLCLADEINRAPAKTQAALLEAMADRSVTADGVTRPLPAPFFVIATQNPVESQGTYPLPEAQLDRFLMKLHVGYPAPGIEKNILHNYVQGFDAANLASANLNQVLTAEHVVAMQEMITSVQVDEGILDYIIQIVGQTRQHRSIFLGASPRAAIAMLQTARVKAASEGRAYVVPDDVKHLAPSVIRHRLVLHPDAEIEGITADDCIQGILREVMVPMTAA